MLSKIAVTMLGGFSVAVDGRVIQEEGTKLTKPWQLFCYLALHRGEIMTGERLLEALWGEEELTDPANVLKNAVYALRREMAGKAKPGDGPILYQGGGYCLNEAISFDVDVQRFEALCAQVEQMEPEREETLAACRSAVAVYTGDFLPMADTELWVAPYVRRYKLSYVAGARRLCDCLALRGFWDELLTVSTRASLAEPLDEGCLVYSFRAMEQMQMPRAIVATYSKTSRFFEEELGQPLCAEIRRIYTAASERVNKAEQDLAVIREDLEDALQQTRPSKGPYYCSYDVFKRMYPILARNAERAKQTQVLVLITLLDHRRRVPGSQLLVPAMSDARMAIHACLRRSDTYARYSKHQYVVLVPLENPDNAAVVERRLLSSYAATASAEKVPLQCRMVRL